MRIHYLLAGLLVASLLWSCGMGGGNKTRVSFDPENTDTLTRPQDDFYRFANGGWMDRTEIPESESSWGGFNELRDENNEQLKALLKSLEGVDIPAGSTDQLVADFYASFMDSVSREEKGHSPIYGYLMDIDELKSVDELPALIAEFNRMGVAAFFRFYVYAHPKDTDVNTQYLSQSGLGLPNRDYYFQDRFAPIREQYKSHVARMLGMIGYSEAEAADMTAKIYVIEEKLAEASRGPVELRDPVKRYNPYSRDGLSALGSFDFDAYFGAMDANFDSLIVGQPEFFEGMNAMLEETPLDDIKAYLRWNVVNSNASHLSTAFEQADFDFYSKTLRGTPAMRARWKRALGALTRNSLSEALGKLYVEKHFPESSKIRVNEMVDNLMAAYRERIETLDWMSAETKAKAQEKLASFKRKLGYPDKWKDLSGLEISDDDYFGNVLALRAFRRQENLDKIGKPVDRTEWGMPPHMINAYYNPLMNEVVFPAAIMQPPFFDADAEDAVNYGRIGWAIGHEITHGFDDNGSQYAADGSLTNWWTDADREKFDERAGKLGDLFDTFCPFEGVCVQSQLTMGENIADLGGLTMAYHAYLKTPEARTGAVVNGYTPEQRFFISAAQTWKSKFRDEALKQLIATNTHSPGMYRVLGPTKNMPEFYEAFGVKEGDGMYLAPELRSVIW